MHPDSPTPPKEKARGDQSSSARPSWTTWQRLDEDLPQWDSWSTLADGPSSPPDSGDGERNHAHGTGASRRPTGIKTFRLSDAPSLDDFSDAGDGAQDRHSADDRRSPSSQPDVELYDHRPLFTPEDGAPRDRAQARADSHGDGYGRPRSSGDGFKSPSAQGDGYESRPVQGDGFGSSAVQGDGFESDSPRGGGFRDPAVQGDGFESPAVQGDGFESPAVHGDGFDTPKVHGDGFGKPSVREDDFDSAPIQGDGYDAPPAGKGNHAQEIEAEEPFEPWNDLSEYPDIAQQKAKRAKTEADDESNSDEGFSALDLRDRVVIMLLFKQVVQIDAVEKAHRRWQKESGGKSKEPLWRVLTMDPAFERDKIFAEAAQVYAFKEADVDKKSAAAFIKKHKDTFAETFWDRMTKLRVLPIRQETQAQKKEKRIIFVSHDPSRPDVNRLMRELKLDSFELQYAPEAEIEALIHEAFPKRNEYLDRVSDGEFAFDLGTSYDQSSSLIDEDALEAEISRSSLINLFEASLVEAVRRGVSDIHIFPNPRKQIEIHFRIDGELECWHREERVHPEAFLAVVKDNTLNVDRFERDTAQDGFIQRKVDDTLIRYRVSVLPVANANQEIRSESIVIRVLDDRKVVTDLGKLGLLDQARAKFEWAIRQPHGMVILTGPTGSGKTTTLFAALHQVVTQKVNVLTVEDPVEYVIPGVRQIKLSHKLALEQALRSILRHDPDIVMVGEMRDRETAELAIKLANTGHLTFSTLHTNDAPSAVSRLYKMGVEPFLIAYAINLVVAQRLLRTLCTKCKRPAKNIDHEMLLRLGFSPQELAQARFYDEGHNPDCRACGGTGYKGRRAITETMAFTDEIRRMIVLSNDMIDEDGLRRQAVADGMLTLRGSAREIVKQGDTSVVELIRVTAGEH